jgi:hypothetical protein
MTKLTALTKLYRRTPTSEEIKNDFGSHVYDAWVAINELHDFLEACHKDGLLWGIARSPDKVLEDFADVRDGLLDGNGESDFELDLKPDHWMDEPTVVATTH